MAKARTVTASTKSTRTYTKDGPTKRPKKSNSPVRTVTRKSPSPRR